jgi:hypothetical protein
MRLSNASTLTLLHPYDVWRFMVSIDAYSIEKLAPSYNNVLEASNSVEKSEVGL